MRPHVAKVTPERTEALIANLAPDDRREVEGLLGGDAGPSIRASVRDSIWCRAVVVDGECAAIFGVVPTVSPEVAKPWLLVTPAVTKVARRFAREARRWLHTMRDVGDYKVLTNLVDTRNKHHVRLLKVLRARLVGPKILEHYQTFEIRF